MNKKKLFIIITFILVVIILISSYVFATFAKEQLNNNLSVSYAQQETLIATEVSNTLTGVIEDVTSKLYVIAQIPDIQKGINPACETQLENLLNGGQANVQNLGRVNAQGYFACSVNNKLIGVKADTLGKYIDTIFQDPLHKPVMSRAILPKGSSSYAAAIHVPVYTAKGQFDGTVGGAIYFNDLQKKYLHNITFAKDGYVIVLDDDGTILYHPKQNVIGTKISTSSAGLVLRDVIKQAVKGKSGVTSYYAKDQKKVAAYAPITISSNRHWVVVVTVPESSIYATILSVGVDQVFNWFIFLSAAVILIASMIFLNIIIKTVFNPLDQIKKVMERIDKGDLSARINIKGKDELGKFAEVFNNMSDKLNVLYKDLEDKVSQRTSELTMKIGELEETKKTTLNVLKDLEVEKNTAERAKAKDDALLNSIGDGLIATDEYSRIAVINKTTESILGYSSQELVGKAFAEMVIAQDEQGNKILPEHRALTDALMTGEKVTRTMYYTRKDGSIFPADVTVSPILLNDKPVGAIEVFRDVTKEKDIDRMKSEFISLASHQLRTPLSAMKWFLEMLIGGDAGELTQQQKEFVTNIDQSNERMIGLVNSLLNVSRIESGRIIIDPEPTDLKELVAQVQVDLKAKLEEKKQHFIISVYEDLPKINVDTKLISQVYLNLLTNAIKYTPPEGEISVFISKKDDKIISQITDNGYGIPQSEQHKIFQKFYRGTNIVKKETDGNGLGMYLVKSIIDSSGGKIWFESVEGKGTSFWFSLPMTGMIAKKRRSDAQYVIMVY